MRRKIRDELVPPRGKKSRKIGKMYFLIRKIIGKVYFCIYNSNGKVYVKKEDSNRNR